MRRTFFRGMFYEIMFPRLDENRRGCCTHPNGKNQNRSEYFRIQALLHPCLLPAAATDRCRALTDTVCATGPGKMRDAYHEIARTGERKCVTLITSSRVRAKTALCRIYMELRMRGEDNCVTLITGLHVRGKIIV